MRVPWAVGGGRGAPVAPSDGTDPNPWSQEGPGPSAFSRMRVNSARFESCTSYQSPEGGKAGKRKGVCASRPPRHLIPTTTMWILYVPGGDPRTRMISLFGECSNFSPFIRPPSSSQHVREGGGGGDATRGCPRPGGRPHTVCRAPILPPVGRVPRPRFVRPPHSLRDTRPLCRCPPSPCRVPSFGPRAASPRPVDGGAPLHQPRTRAPFWFFFGPSRLRACSDPAEA